MLPVCSVNDVAGLHHGSSPHPPTVSSPRPFGFAVQRSPPCARHAGWGSIRRSVCPCSDIVGSLAAPPPHPRLPSKSGERPSSGAARLAGGGWWVNSIQLSRTGGLRPGDWGGDGSSPHPATASSPPGPSGLPSSDLPPVPGLQSGAPPGVAFAHVPTLSIALREAPARLG